MHAGTRVRLVKHPTHTGLIINTLGPDNTYDTLESGEVVRYRDIDMRYGLEPTTRFIVKWDGGRGQHTTIRQEFLEEEPHNTPTGS